MIQHTNVCVLKIDGLKLDTLAIDIAFFLVKDKDKRSRFLIKIFLLANFGINIDLVMFFLTLSNIKVNFVNQKVNFVNQTFNKKLYTTIEALLIMKQVELIRKKKFVAVILYAKDQTFIVYVASINQNSNSHLFRKA